MEDETKQEEENKEEKAVESLTAVADRLEKANKEAKEILARQEELIARNLLGGKTDAGLQPTKKEEETPAEYTKRVMSGGL